VPPLCSNSGGIWRYFIDIRDFSHIHEITPWKLRCISRRERFLTNVMIF
jgi:hypothetical protein